MDIEQKVDAMFHPENYIENDPDFWLLFDAVLRDWQHGSIRYCEPYPTMDELLERTYLLMNTSAGQIMIIERREQNKTAFDYCKAHSNIRSRRSAEKTE